jgi:hypothetical protein
MSGQRLEKFYSNFGGLDTRSNKLLSKATSFREGSKNFRYNFKDELQNANGFQHKSIAGGAVNLGDIEYKYKDLNTGEEKLEYLYVGGDGLLYKKHAHYLKITNVGSALNYSFYYDETIDNFVFQMTISGTGIVSTSFNETYSLSSLKTFINSQGLTCDIVDEDGNPVVSSKLAYLMDVAINQALTIGVNNAISAQYWDVVTYPSVGNFNTEVPFVTSKDFHTSTDYEGVSYVNINNCCYITDGGFPMKYDGKVIARAGMAKILKPGGNGLAAPVQDFNLSGFSITPVNKSSGQLTRNKKYNYVFQHGYVDYQGSEILGAFETGSNQLYMNTNTLDNNAISIVRGGLSYNPNFPIFSCTVSSNQNIPTGGGTFNVYAEHNIKPGMLLRIPINNALIGFPGYSFIMTNVSAVTATSVTVDFGQTSSLYPFNNDAMSLLGNRTSGNNFASTMGLATTADTSSGSNIITNVGFVTGVKIGDEIFSTYFPAGTLVTLVGPGNTLKLSSVATGTAVGGAISINYGVRVKVGASVTGTGIPANTFVISVGGSGSVVTFNNNVTSTSSNAMIFTNYPTLIIANQVINGGYAQDIYKNKISNPNFDFGFCPKIPFGAFTRVYRSTADTDSMYKLIDLPLQRSGVTNVFVDDFADGPAVDSLSRLALIDADHGGELPRACKYLTKWQDQIVQSGRPVDPSIKDLPYPTSYYNVVTNAWGFQDTSYLNYQYTEAHLCDFQSVYWNDTLLPEGFPQDGLHEFIVNTKGSDKIKGVAQNKDALFAFKERSTGVLVGSLADNDIQLEVLEDDIGCANHLSIQDVGGSLIWLDKVNGFYSCIAGRLPVNIGYPISDFQKINATGLDYSKACAANFRKENLYICAVGSTTFVFDYAHDGTEKRNCWYLWDRINTKSILATSNDELLINDGLYSWKIKTTLTAYDFTDHRSAIEFIANTAWNSSGAPTVDKHYLGLWISSVQGGFSLDITQYANFLNAPISSLSNIAFLAENDLKKGIKNVFKAAIPKLSGTSFGIRNFEKNKWVRIQGYEIQLSNDFDSGEPKK